MKKSGVKAAKIIHGYGSTGKGGRLRKATIKLLEESKTNGLIKEFIIGNSGRSLNCERSH
jgi:DNA-nicking Smr family endonuclease